MWNFHKGDSATLAAAGELYARALALDPTGAEIWAVAAKADAWTVYRTFDSSPERRQKAQEEASHAVALAPESFAARNARAFVFAFAVGSPSTFSAADRMYRALLVERPGDRALAEEFGVVLRDEGHFEEAAVLDEKNGFDIDAGWNYFVAGRFDEAGRIADRLNAGQPATSVSQLKFAVAFNGFEDLAAMQAAVSQFTPDELLSDELEWDAVFTALCRRKPDEAIQLLDEFPRDFISNISYYGPKRYYSGIAHEMAGRSEAARAEWRTALQETQELLGNKLNDVPLLWDEAVVLACLGEVEKAGQVLHLEQGFTKPESNYIFWNATVLLRMGRREEALADVSSAINGKGPHWVGHHAALRLFPELDPLRGDPRFQKLLRDNLPKYAKPLD